MPTAGVYVGNDCLAWFARLYKRFFFVCLPFKCFLLKATSHSQKVIVMVLDTDNLPFSTDMPHRFSAGNRAAIRWRPRDNARICTIVRGWTRKRTYLTEDGYRLLNPCSHATAEALPNCQPFCHTHPRYIFHTYVYLWRRNKTVSASQATSRHKWRSPFSARIRAKFLSRFFHAVSWGKSTRYRAENPSASAQISVSARTGNSRNSLENVSYPCQVPYIMEL